MPTTRAIAQVHVGLWNKKYASERVVWEREANRMAICRKKNISEALDDVQDETLRLRRRIAQRVADRRQMSMAEAAFLTSNHGQNQDGTCNLTARQARLGLRPQESRRRPAALPAGSAREAPRGGRLACEPPDTLSKLQFAWWLCRMFESRITVSSAV